MFSLGFVIAASLLVVLMIINIVVSLTTSNQSYAMYVPAGVLFAIGLILLSISSAGRIEMIGLGFGGWGGASLFAAAVGLLATSLVDTYNHSEQ
ncbi:hypothetical protein GCM10008983_26150 [Lentibacillus halophilus]|uniref:YesK-like protein n=1 Tax=Lentibacillus halophilus TaxID=295065 RepID=A0ABN0ZGL3_9BACI